MIAYKYICKKFCSSFTCVALLATGIFVFALNISVTPSSASETMLVHVDQAKVLRLEHPAGTIIIGNPMIADATVQDEQMLVITGKSYGTTNLIILDRDGREIISTNIEVRYMASSHVTIQRGVSRFSYACSPSCEPTLRIGDNPDQFNAVKAAIEGRIESSTGGGPSSQQ